MTDRIVVTRHISASPSVVYEYLTKSELWARWQGVEAAIDSSPGGIFAVEMPNGARARGQFVELEPDQRVVFTWGWIDHPGVPPGSSTVEIDLVRTADGTMVILTHTGLTPEEMGIHRTGWEHYLPRLAMAAEGGNPGADPH